MQEIIRCQLRNKQYDENYYLTRDMVNQKPYQPYKKDEKGAVWVLTKDERIIELEKASSVVRSLTDGYVEDDNKLFFPKEVHIEN